MWLFDLGKDVTFYFFNLGLSEDNIEQAKSNRNLDLNDN